MSRHFFTGNIDPRNERITVQQLPEWFPGVGFKQYARKCKQLMRQLRDLPFDFVRKQMAEGIAPYAMVSEMMEERGRARHQVGRGSDLRW